MKPTASLVLSAVPSRLGGTKIAVSVMLRSEDGSGSGMEKEVHMPAAPDLYDLWDWAQTVLCAATDGLDELDDITTYSIPTQRGGGCADA